MTVLAFVLTGCADPPVPAPPPAPAGPTVTVLTYNVNFERYHDATVHAITGAGADVVFLQETTARWEAAMRPALADRYPTMVFRAHDPDGGMAVLSQSNITTIATPASPAGAFPAWCLVVETALGPLRVVHAHLHPPLDENGLMTGYFTTGGKRRDEAVAHLGCFDGPPDLFLGDLNEGEGDAIDALVTAGLRDAASWFSPPVRTWTWDSDWGELEGRPDHVMLGPGLAAAAVDVLETGASDHLPLRVRVGRVASP